MKNYIKNIVKLIVNRPLLFFVAALIILFVLIAISSKLRTTTDGVQEKEIQAMPVETVRVTDAQYTELSGQVEKNGVITIISQVPGIVHSIYVEDGQSVYIGQRIAYLSDTYSGGSSAAIGYEIAARQAQTQDETFDKRMGVIDEQRDDVRKTNDLEATIMRKQYTIQKRNTELEFDIAQLQKKQSAITAARFSPVSPFKGVVDHVFVSRGETVNVGDKIAVINADDQTATISINISPALAGVIDISKPSVINVNGERINILPRNLSRGVAQDQSYILTYYIEKQYIDLFDNNEFVSVSVPLETNAGDNNSLLVPLDAVRLMSDRTVIFVVEDGVAYARDVERGEVVGGFIFVNVDLGENTEIILNRNVYDGDRVVTKAS